ncbi:MAG: DoxX family protein [Candidatus Paceibacterota bacterium]
MISFLLVFQDWGLLILRFILGLTLIVHGLPKIKNLKKTAKDFAGMGFKPGKFWGSLVTFLEVFGGIGLMLGLLTQIISVLIIFQFLVIILKLKSGSGFKDIELDLLILGAVLITATFGGGIYSLDSLLNLYLY